ncbi:leucine rich adaptor protein 1-like [Protopterus annectens]|uniref:leucine rich adaptor protein 1-like n=1 Tax=Protopterus annectens TaxID=7888 RepID=UPI001CFA6105|nr:leucine rich adaptor protein 1-like [Protopterus annectens]
MEDGAFPELKDIERKLGRKVPESLIRSLREDHLGHLRGGMKEDKGSSIPGSPKGPAQPNNTLDRLETKIHLLRQEMVRLRAIDVKLMHQLLCINEGIESLKWAMEEKDTMTSRDSSLAGSLYSLLESQDTSLRGSCNSLQDGSEGLDDISVGSYLDTLADDMPENCYPADLDQFNDAPIIQDSLDVHPFHKDINVNPDVYYSFG